MKSKMTHSEKDKYIKKLENLLGNVTWVQPMYNGSPSCSCCGNQKHWGHSETCEIAKFCDDKGGEI